MVNRPEQSDVNPPSLGSANNQRGNFTHPADSAVLLLIAGCSSGFSPGAEKRNRHYQSHRSRRPTRRGETLIDEKRKKEADPSVSSIQHLL